MSTLLLACLRMTHHHHHHHHLEGVGFPTAGNARTNSKRWYGCTGAPIGFIGELGKSCWRESWGNPVGEFGIGSVCVVLDFFGNILCRGGGGKGEMKGGRGEDEGGKMRR